MSIRQKYIGYLQIELLKSNQICKVAIKTLEFSELI